MQRISINFIHGLESGPMGTKHRWFINKFGIKNTTCLDMKTSLCRLDKSNSVLGNIIKNIKKNGFENLIEQSVEDSFQSCVDIQSHYLKNHSIDLIVGSSWGGAIATELISSGSWNGPTVFLAPSYEKYMNQCGKQHLISETYQKINDLLNSETKKKCFIVHGTNDKVIPIEHSRNMSQQTKIPLFEIENGDHSLNNYILKPTINENYENCDHTDEILELLIRRVI